MPTSTRFTLLAEEEGLEPSDAGIKTQCLNQLGDSPINFFALVCKLISLLND